MRFSVQKGRTIPAPQYRTAPGPLTPAVNSGAFYGTTGVGGDLYAAAQDATRAMIDHLTSSYALSREDAYLLCSLVVDLKISEIVDAGQYVVSAVLPESIFAELADRSPAGCGTSGCLPGAVCLRSRPRGRAGTLAERRRGDPPRVR